MRHFLLLLLSALCLFIGLSQTVSAQNTANPNRNEPLEISADETLEWYRNELFFRATKNVIAVQGGTTLYADVMKALYRESDKSSIDIYEIGATGSVKIVSAETTVYGDQAQYDVDKGYALLTGNDLRLISDEQILTARDKFEYWMVSGRFEAHGKAVALRLGDKIEADKMIAIFVEDSQGERVLKTVEAIGSVVITTPTEVLTGDRGLYHAASETAELIDNVTIKRGPNILNGSQAKVNLRTNVSKLFGGSATQEGGRVRGVFYPGSKEKE